MSSRICSKAKARVKTVRSVRTVSGTSQRRTLATVTVSAPTGITQEATPTKSPIAVINGPCTR